MSESTAKQRIREIVDKLPPETTVEEVMEHLYVLAKIERGIAQADAGQTLSSEEVRARLRL